MKSFVLTISCEDKLGIIALVTNFLSREGFNIVESAQFHDKNTNNFFMRTEFQKKECDLSKLKEKFLINVASKIEMEWAISATGQKCPAIILVSKEDHCLNNLIYKSRNSNTPIDIKAVVSNHKNLQKPVEDMGLEFHYFPIIDNNKKNQENKILEIFESTKSELVILARYMQILSDNFCSEIKGKGINIHHSFLPGFKGSKPYHQAYERGVKIVGASAHYITKDLDEGPLITQETIRVNHSMTPEILADIGKDIESMVLAKSVKLHCEKRIFINKNKTVIFDI